jgi:hypothetical protein
MTRRSLRGLATACALVLVAVLAGSTSTAAAGDQSKTRHVLLLSVDGLHQTDLAWYVSHKPHSALAVLTNGGVEFTQAQTPVPSDSFPGMVAQVTGGNPKSTGVYYDDSYNHALLPSGTTSCAGVKPGVEVTYFEAAARDPHSIDSGQGLAGLPGSILQLTSNPRTLINPAVLPVDPSSCQPVYPTANTSSGLVTVYAGVAAAAYFGVAPGDPRVPDIFGIAKVGTVFTGGHGKIAEHGGANPQDRAVPLLVSGASVDERGVNSERVETTQIAPTILSLLGLRPDALKSVRIEGTEVLPLGDLGGDETGITSPGGAPTLRARKPPPDGVNRRVEARP